MEAQSPNFESIKQISPYQAEHWSTRDIAPLLGYNKWQNFEVAVQQATIACQQVGQIVTDHFTDVSKIIDVGKGAQRSVKDYTLSRFACYLIAQNGDKPSKILEVRCPKTLHQNPPSSHCWMQKIGNGRNWPPSLIRMIQLQVYLLKILYGSEDYRSCEIGD